MVDAITGQPLPGSEIIVLQIGLGAVADTNGRYLLARVPTGSHSIQARMMGYRPQTLPQVEIMAGRVRELNFYLVPTVLKGKQVEISGGYFSPLGKTKFMHRRVDQAEIETDPAGAYDVMQMMQSLPAVVSTTDQSNEVIVRGGAPGENLFVMDHLDVLYPVHFPQQGYGGGPITLINSDFVDHIDFYAGAFDTRYGERLSSVMDVSLREGNRLKHQGKIGINMAGFGIEAEGPYGSAGSYLFAVERSFLDLVIRSTGFTAVPEYWTTQAKLTRSVGRSGKLMLNFLGGWDAIKLENESSPISRGVENVAYNSHENTSGITYKQLLGNSGYIVTSLGLSQSEMDIDVYRIKEDSSDITIFHERPREQELTFKFDLTHRFPSQRHRLDVGLLAKRVMLNLYNHIYPDTVFLWGYRFNPDEPPRMVDSLTFWNEVFENDDVEPVPLGIYYTVTDSTTHRSLTFNRLAFYLQFHHSLGQGVNLLWGLRWEESLLSRQAHWSPRVSLTWHAAPKLEFHIAGGRYYQGPANALLTHMERPPASLKDYYADQITIGLEYRPRSDMRITWELYAKEFNNKPIRERLKNPVTGADSLGDFVNEGRGRSRGIEFYWQKHFANNWYAIASYSYSKAEGFDSRDPTGKTTFPWDYDYGHTYSLIGGYKIIFRNFSWYGAYKESLWSKLLSWLPFMPSDEYEISFRLRYQGGRPYTPKIFDPTLRRWNIYPYQQLNTERFDFYRRFDIMLRQRFYFDRINLVAFWDIMNVFNRDNPWDYVYKDDGHKILALQYKTFPVGGVVLEF